METLTVQQPQDAQWRLVTEAISRAFSAPEMDDESHRDHLRPVDRRLALLRGEQVVGGCISYVFDLCLPGGALVPTAGLAGVGILPPAQGAGGLRLLVQAHLENCIEHGDTLSALMASESGLYSRFGYGAATEMAEYRLDTRMFSLKRPVTKGRIELITDSASARTICAQIHGSQVGAGELQRSADWWEQVIHSGERSWLGGGPQFVAVHRNTNGQADGYALYVVDSPSAEHGTSDGIQRSRVILRELVSLNIEAEAAMFQYLCSIAWVRELRWILAPVDPPVKHLMSDPRQLVQVYRSDMLWLRVLDMPRLLTERSYDCLAEVEFSYVDEQFPQFSGDFRLTTGTKVSQQTTVERIEKVDSDLLTFGPEQLAACVLGGTRLAYLYRLGEITGPEQALKRLDRLLLSDRAPFNLSKF